MSAFHQAKALLAQGFRIVPTDGKEAIADGFDAASVDFTCGPEWFAEPGTRVGVLCGPCPAIAPDWLLCVDIDGPFEAVPVLADFLASLPPTLTSHRQRHLFFRIPPGPARDALKQWGDVFRTKKATGAAIDLKWAGGYACEAWDWAPGTPRDALAGAIATLPADALAALLAARADRLAPAPLALPSGADPGEDVRGDEALRAAGFDPATVREDAARWLRESAPLPIEGTGGATLMVVFGALMIGFGLDDEAALQLAVDVYAERAWPGEDPDIEGFEHKIDQIDQHGSDRWPTPLELAWLAATVRAGMALTRPDAITTGLAMLPPAAPALDVEAATNALYTLENRIARNQKGEVKNNAYNTDITLELHPAWSGLFGYDDFTHSVVYMRDSAIPGLPARAGDIFHEDHDTTAIQIWFAQHTHEPNPAALIAAVHHAARQRRFHAVQAYLARVREQGWDGIDRNLVEYLGAEPTPYHRSVCAKWLRSAVARAMVPGEKADNMLILEGRQGLKKSTALKCLCPDTRWFYEAASRMVGSKDFMQDMNGKWICEIPEVDQLISSRDESELKALLTRRSDNYRPSYARKSSDFLRQLVFAATTNKNGYLRDETGNRRYWAVACGALGPILDAKLCDDRDQIWAQALHEYEAGMPWHLDAAEEALAMAEQEARLEGDPWTEHLTKWLAERGDPPEPFTVHEALAGLPGAKPVADQTQADLNRMGKVLRKMGLVNGQVRVGGQRRSLWRQP